MNAIATLSLLLLAVSMVLCQSCPRHCDHPKSELQCRACLDQGYSDIVLGRGEGKAVRDRLGKDMNKLERGAYAEWTKNRCFIHLKGIKSKADCKWFTKSIFGNDKCAGFHDYDYTLAGKCWAEWRIA